MTSTGLRFGKNLILGSYSTPEIWVTIETLAVNYKTSGTTEIKKIWGHDGNELNVSNAIRYCVIKQVGIMYVLDGNKSSDDTGI